MPSSPQAPGLQKLRFDVYEADPRAGELRKHGYRIPLEDRPFRALLILVQHAPELVTREELQKQLWPADVFIDFDHGLNKAIGKIRKALNDSVDKPRFVETVGRRGYRFIAPLTPEDVQDAVPVAAPTGGTAPIESLVSRRSQGSIRWIAAVACAAILLAAYLFRPQVSKPHIVSIVQVTTSGEAWPFEPLATDGPRLYYQSLAQNLSPDAPAGIWRVKQVLLNGNEETVIPGTSDRIHSFRVRGLSSDDTEFLALSRAGTGDDWMAATLPVVGGSPRRLGSFLADDLAWSHDGKTLAYTQGRQLLLSNPDGTGSRLLTTAPGTIAYLRWSPDDRQLGFTVLTERHALWEVGADGRGLHERHLNLPGKAMECCGAWTPDGRYYVFRSDREGLSNLWAVEEKTPWWRRSGRDPVQLTFGPMDYYQPLPSRNGKTIFAVGTLSSGELVHYDPKQKDFVRTLSGLSADRIEFTRDGKWIAYVTVPDRCLWRARSDGTERFQLTFPPLQVDSRPHWSADGKRITFGAKRPGELMRLYTIAPENGVSEELPADAESQATPDWMPDAKSLIYGRFPGIDPPSTIALYQLDLQTHRSEKVPGSDGLYSPLWSYDGQRLATVDADSQRLVLFDIKTGKRTPISQPAVFPVWSPDSQYIYFEALPHEIFRVHVADGREEIAVDVPFRTGGACFGLTPEGDLLILREHGHYDIYALSLVTQ